jgi:hypothetical protein
MGKEVAISFSSEGSHVPMIWTPIIALCSTTWRQSPPRLSCQFMFQPAPSLQALPPTQHLNNEFMLHC